MLKVPNVTGSNNVSLLSTNFNANFDVFTSHVPGVRSDYRIHGMVCRHAKKMGCAA